MPALGGFFQRRPPGVLTAHAHLRAGGEQLPHDLGPPVPRGFDEGRVPLRIDRVDVRPVREQDGGDLRVGTEVEQRPAVVIQVVDVEALATERIVVIAERPCGVCCSSRSSVDFHDLKSMPLIRTISGEYDILAPTAPLPERMETT